MIFKILGWIIVIFGLALPAAKFNRQERYRNLRSFLIWLVWFVIGIAIAGVGVWVYHLGA